MPADKLKKIDKEYVLSDNSVNVYGFRLLTEGYQLAEFQKNPIGYYMHERNNGVVLKWENVRIEGDKVLGTPVINLSNARGQQTLDEAESGFLNAASVGHIVVLEYSTEPDLMLEGQTGPTITKWYNKECSLVDIPGNGNALTQLYDADEKVINLADLTNNNLTPDSIMKKVTLNLSADLLKHLNLADTTDEAGINIAVANLSAKAAQADKLLEQNQKLTTERDTAKTELADLKKTTTEKEVTDILDKALADKKINVAAQKELAKQFAGNPTALKDLVAAMPAYQSIADALGKGDKSKVKNLADKTWEELDKSGRLKDLKDNDPDLYQQKKEEWLESLKRN